jgi:hypothetical protein
LSKQLNLKHKFFHSQTRGVTLSNKLTQLLTQSSKLWICKYCDKNKKSLPITLIFAHPDPVLSFKIIYKLLHKFRLLIQTHLFRSTSHWAVTMSTVFRSATSNSPTSLMVFNKKKFFCFLRLWVMWDFYFVDELGFVLINKFLWTRSR